MHPRTEIDRYLSFGLSAAAEVRLRTHIGACPGCLDHYDLQIRLHRFLAGDLEAATRAEDERLVVRVMRQIDLGKQSDRVKRTDLEPSGVGWFDRLLWAPTTVLAGSALMLLIALVAAVGWWASGPAGEPASVARLALARGVQIDGLRPAVGQPGADRLLDGQHIAVGSRGAAELTLRRGGKLRLFPSSEAVLSEGGDRVDLRRGRIWCQIAPGHGSFQVLTSSARVEVVGTSFLVWVSASGATDVRVDSGVVAVRDNRGQGEVRVRAGQTTRVVSGQAPAPVRRARRAGRSLESEWDRIVQGLEEAIEELKDLFR